MKEIVAFIHAKGTSERVPSKNLRFLGDRPLFCHAIANALASSLVTRVVIDSDSEEILRLGELHGAEPLRRPAVLATNRASGDDLAYWQASNAADSEVVLQVIPTAPFLRPESIDRGIDLLLRLGVDSVAGVFSDTLYRWENGRPAYFRPDGSIPNSFELDPVVFETTGLYINRTTAVLRSRKRMNPASCAPLPLSRLESIDINTPEDFDFAEVVWCGLEATGARRDGVETGARDGAPVRWLHEHASLRRASR